ncbi:MAG: zf-HC2 domain-containing protein [Planctomycetota bacterium]|jgi:predicted anti-sigma-YlaC factor YlaD
MNAIPSCEHDKQLITGYLDGELTQGDRQRVELQIESCDSCRRTFDDLTQLRDDVASLTFGRMEPEEWSEIMDSVTVKTSRWLGWALYIGGAVLLIAFATYQFFISDEEPIVLIGFGALYLGLFFLFVSVLRQRMIASKTDKYKDVQI